MRGTEALGGNFVGGRGAKTASVTNGMAAAMGTELPVVPAIMDEGGNSRRYEDTLRYRAQAEQVTL